jgi:hypothetical protein
LMLKLAAERLPLVGCQGVEPRRGVPRSAPTLAVARNESR